MHISGTFEAQLSPVDNYAKGINGNDLARMTIDKFFHGDLAATSKGEMLSAMTATQGSAGYVAIEQVQGRLAGKEGTFVLQHFGIMDKGEDYLKLQVIPNSGTGALVGLAGTMVIDMVDGEHRYEFDYTIFN